MARDFGICALALTLARYTLRRRRRREPAALCREVVRLRRRLGRVRMGHPVSATPDAGRD